MYVPLYVCECECFFNVSRSKISEAYRTKPKLVGVFSVVFFLLLIHFDVYTCATESVAV